MTTNAPPPYEPDVDHDAPPPYNQSGNQYEPKPAPVSSAPGSSMGNYNLLHSRIRYTVLLTILLTFILPALVYSAIWHDNLVFDSDDDGKFKAVLAAVCLIFIGCVIALFVILFMTSMPSILHKFCGALIVIGGIIWLVTWIVIINDSTSGRTACESDQYVCCVCIEIATECVLVGLTVIIIGADIASDFAHTLQKRVTSFALVFVAFALLVVVTLFENSGDFGDLDALSQATYIGFCGIVAFGILAVVAVHVPNAIFMRIVGVAFGASCLLTLLFIDEITSVSVIDEVTNSNLFVGMAGLITYDLVSSSK